MIQITNPRRFFLFGGAIIIFIGGIVWLNLRSAQVVQNGEVLIERGDSAQVVWDKLVEAELSDGTLVWRYHAWRQGAADELKAGRYQIEQDETVAEVVRRFAAGDALPDELTITYPEGFTIEQMAERTAARGIGEAPAFIAAADPPAFAEQYPYMADIPAGRDLEGYLFPDTYRVFADDTPGDVIRRMLAAFDQKFTEQLRQEAAAAGRTLDEIVIMASVIEREVITEEDMAMVSGVLWKRVDEGMGLDADATVRYALNKWDGALTVQDLQIDSPYNTRRYRGLPPGPISNPGLQALVAAVRPEESEYYYYLSTPEGETIFSRTNDEHNVNKARYLR